MQFTTTPALDNYVRLAGRQTTFFRASVGAVRLRLSAAKRRGGARREATLNKYLDLLQSAEEFAIVSSVAAVEAYLTDVLAFCASVTPDLMRDSQQAAEYVELLEAKDLEELRSELRRRWARNFVDRGGPAVWIQRLERMGAQPYPAELAPQMERLWGLRHVIVHAGSVATRDFVARHPEFGERVGERIDMARRHFGAEREAGTDFVKLTDVFLSNRFGRS